MRSYVKKIVAVMALALGVMACTEVDDTLGLDLVPTNQKMVIAMDDCSGLIDMCTVITDSICTNNLGFAAFGYRNSEKFGKTFASAYFQYVSYEWPEAYIDEGYYGEYNVVDSVVLNLNLSDVSIGDNTSTEPIKFGIYSAEAPEGIFRYDSTYYQNFDIKPYLSTEPLFTFELSSEDMGENNIVLDYGDQGAEYIKKLVSLDNDIYSSDDADSLFINEMQGLYLAPIESEIRTTDGGAIFFAPYSQTSEWVLAMTLYVRTFTDSSYTTPKDTISHSYLMMDDILYHNSLTIGMFDHDYTGSEVDSYIAQTADGERPDQDRVFVQGMGGLGMYVNFNDAFVDRLMELKTKDGVEYSNIVFNRAVVSFSLPEAERSVPEFLDVATTGLGMYYTFSGAILSYAPDYDPAYESSGIETAYGGNLNRVKGKYEMDISRYVQQLVGEREGSVLVQTLQRNVIFAPKYTSGPFSQFNTYTQVEMIGTSSAEKELVPHFEFTYTLIK